LDSLQDDDLADLHHVLNVYRDVAKMDFLGKRPQQGPALLEALGWLDFQPATVAALPGPPLDVRELESLVPQEIWNFSLNTEPDL